MIAKTAGGREERLEHHNLVVIVNHTDFRGRIAVLDLDGAGDTVRCWLGDHHCVQLRPRDIRLVAPGDTVERPLMWEKE